MGDGLFNKPSNKTQVIASFDCNWVLKYVRLKNWLAIMWY